MRAKIVIGLCWGDEGKGITTDYLCSQANNPIVIRFSGGQQAGHTVMMSGIKHVHSSFGSGTLRGIPTLFSEHTTIYPNSIDREKLVLKSKGIEPILYVHPLANLTTPYDVAFGRQKERLTGHGSCGLGIGATMKRNLESPCKIFAIDFMYPQILKEKLKAIKNYYNFTENTYSQDLIDIELPYFMELSKNPPFKIKDYTILNKYTDWIFEGSQGILLDAQHGIFPNVTYANTTSKNALEILNQLSNKRFVDIYYITRCYQTRHGEGWMSNNEKISLINNEEEINVTNPWQKEFKVGELDYDLLNYSLDIDNCYASTYHWISKNLVVTCLDQRPDFKFDAKKLNTNYQNFQSLLGSYSPITNFKVLN